MTVGARPSKAAAVALAIRLAPQYAEPLRYVQGAGGRMQFTERIRAIMNWVGPLVVFYENDEKLNAVLTLGLLGEQGLKDWANDLEALQPDQQQRYLDELVSDQELEASLDFALPETEEAWRTAEEKMKGPP